MHASCRLVATDTWARNLLQKKVLRAAGARRQPFPAHVPLPSGGHPTHGWARRPPMGSRGPWPGGPVPRVSCGLPSAPPARAGSARAGMRLALLRAQVEHAPRGAGRTVPLRGADLEHRSVGSRSFRTSAMGGWRPGERWAAPRSCLSICPRPPWCSLRTSPARRGHGENGGRKRQCSL